MEYGMSAEYYEQFIEEIPCATCHGRRLNPMSLAVTVGGLAIDEFCDLLVDRALEYVSNTALELTETEMKIVKEVLKEIRSRLTFLQSVGLGYLTLSRRAGTLSGGEAQRIRLATQIGSSLVGVLYVLDEPSIGLHQRDNDLLISTLKQLRDLGNTVIVVEHDEDMMRKSDYIVDIGPGAGIHGGNVVAAGTPAEVAADPNSLTGAYLSGVTGVSGSGKSSLVNGIINPVLSAALNGARRRPGNCDGIDGIEFLDKVIDIDQSPIGRTPRSNPATYTGLFNDIRDLFASTRDANVRGYKAGRFSFNVKGGRCEACQGDGVRRIEMHFLPDVYVTCDVCHGKRYNHDTLEVKYKGKNIYEVLEMTAEEGVVFFDGLPKIRRKLQTLCDVGLGYIKIGQSSTTISGGEAQRVKLATELSRRGTGKTMYILDEPTTGLHTEDVSRLLTVLQRFVDAGNTVLVIEHNMEVIKTADYLIDLGPEGGDGGGTLVACGTPEEVAAIPASYTGKYLREHLPALGTVQNDKK